LNYNLFKKGNEIMINLKSTALALITAGLLSLSVSAQAWNGSVIGTISEIDGLAAAGGATNGNLDVRVYINGVSTMCTGSSANFGYVNISDVGYKTILAQLLMAQATNKTVHIYTNLVNGYCQIGFLSILS